MADQTSPSGAPSVSAPRSEGQGQGRGRGRGQGQGQGRGRGAGGNENRQSDSRGGRRGGGRGGNRGGAAINAAPVAQKKAEIVPRPTIEAKEGEEDVEAEVCFICASPVVHNSVAPCNHRTCHICALRMRALYKTRDCAHCRTPAPFVIFTDDATKRFEDFTDLESLPTDTAIGIRYENEEIQIDTRILLRYNCPDAECDVACLSWPDLHKHVRGTHHKKICDLCSRHKKVFTHEHELYTDRELNTHLTKGDDNPGAIDQSGFKGHPLCGFCKQRFYGEDELYVHCREKHERCFICDRRGGSAVYYVNYDSLEVHFRKSHFLCPDQGCLDKKFIVFPSEIDLKAHQLDEHGDTLSKDVRRDARMVDLSAFNNLREAYVEPTRGGRSQREQRNERGRGRGRDPNAEPLPASTAQPLPRDQQAFQRQMAIHSAQSVATRTFGGQLTQSAPAPRAQAAAGSRDPPTVSTNPSARVEATTNAVRELDLSQNLAPADQARALRHRTVIERATILLQNDTPKLSQFRSLISSFQSSSISARALIDDFFNLFADTSSTALGTLIREVADLYEDKAKADGLRAAWNDWRAINEDYPSLPGPAPSSTAFPGGWAGATSGSSTNTNTAPKSTRVLKLKNSTAQSSRSSVSQTRSWGTASANPISSSSTSASSSSLTNPFPNLPSSSSSQSQGRITTVPWSAPSSTTSQNAAPISRPAVGRGRAAGDAFPALPPAKKPQSTIFGYGNGNLVRRDLGNGAPSNFAWGGGNGNANGGGEGAGGKDGGGVDGVGEEGRSKRKGNKGKKQVLMNWG